MRIYLAGANGKMRIISALRGGYKDMRIYLAGGVTGNLNPAWKRMAKTEITPNGLIRGLVDENFWRGGRHDTGYRM